MIRWRRIKLPQKEREVDFAYLFRKVGKWTTHKNHHTKRESQQGRNNNDPQLHICMTPKTTKHLEDINLCGCGVGKERRLKKVGLTLKTFTCHHRGKNPIRAHHHAIRLFKISVEQRRGSKREDPPSSKSMRPKAHRQGCTKGQRLQRSAPFQAFPLELVCFPVTQFRS